MINVMIRPQTYRRIDNTPIFLALVIAIPKPIANAAGITSDMINFTAGAALCNALKNPDIFVLLSELDHPVSYF
jgi:hypothetical protein